MTKETDRAMFESNFVRNANDQYWTESAVTKALVRNMPDGLTNIWEPFAGRGDMTRVLMDFGGYTVFNSDKDTSNFDRGLGEIEEFDFLRLDGVQPMLTIENEIDGLCSNPPFGKEAELSVRRALTGYPDIRFFSFVLRSEWKHGSGRRDLFGNSAKGLPAQPYSMEIALQWRPRWDWWFRDKPEASPRHNYSIFCWNRAHQGPPIQRFATRNA